MKSYLLATAFGVAWAQRERIGDSYLQEEEIVEESSSDDCGDPISKKRDIGTVFWYPSFTGITDVFPWEFGTTDNGINFPQKGGLTIERAVVVVMWNGWYNMDECCPKGVYYKNCKTSEQNAENYHHPAEGDVQNCPLQSQSTPSKNGPTQNFIYKGLTPTMSFCEKVAKAKGVTCEFYMRPDGKNAKYMIPYFEQEFNKFEEIVGKWATNTITEKDFDENATDTPLEKGNFPAATFGGGVTGWSKAAPSKTPRTTVGGFINEPGTYAASGAYYDREAATSMQSSVHMWKKVDAYNLNCNTNIQKATINGSIRPVAQGMGSPADGSEFYGPIAVDFTGGNNIGMPDSENYNAYTPANGGSCKLFGSTEDVGAVEGGHGVATHTISNCYTKAELAAEFGKAAANLFNRWNMWYPLGGNSPYTKDGGTPMAYLGGCGLAVDQHGNYIDDGHGNYLSNCGSPDAFHPIEIDLDLSAVWSNPTDAIAHFNAAVSKAVKTNHKYKNFPIPSVLIDSAGKPIPLGTAKLFNTTKGTDDTFSIFDIPSLPISKEQDIAESNKSVALALQQIKDKGGKIKLAGVQASDCALDYGITKPGPGLKSSTAIDAFVAFREQVSCNKKNSPDEIKNCDRSTFETIDFGLFT